MSICLDCGRSLLVTVWGKNQKANISQAERNALAKAIREVERALEQREKP